MRTLTSQDDWLESLIATETVYVLFSGGKDSLVAMDYTSQLLEQHHASARLVALHVDTTIGFPATEVYVQDVCRSLGVRLQTLKPREDYEELTRRWGVPRPRARWCCFHLKIQPIKDFLSDKSNYVVIDGIRRKESRKRSQYPATYQHPHMGFVIHPIIDWTDADVDNYIREHELPVNPAYALGFGSWECWCGVFKRKSEFERLRDVDPAFFMKLVRIENSLCSGYAYAYFGGEPFYLRSLLEQTGQTSTTDSPQIAVAE